ncbi:MAG: RNB domain-containing ribonuclease [Paludibacteraceae bacterium]|nr:RNB domain-containing ribonuclease [Paludibacteraceae bacterium]
MKMFLEKEIDRRRDFRETLTFTIDPSDAKDFDDALSFEVLEDGSYQVGVHIADVTHYVHLGSKENDDAYKRGTSVYLVDGVLPMLPESLCNDLCSLRPNEDKLCMSVVFNLSRDARVLKYKVCRTVIRSDYRLTYTQAQQIIKEGVRDAKDDRLCEALKTLNFLAVIMRRKRMEAGALDIEQEQIQFQLDKNGRPTDIYFVQMTDANHLIEEFMLLANRTIATQLSKTGKEMVFRVHDKPDEKKMEELKRFERYIGERIPKSMMEMFVIRAMAKAVYSTDNIGHYGLAFDYYTHFTSPIRRYPDMIVHRLVAKYLLGERGVAVDKDLSEACDHLSAMEQEAVQAERDSQKDFQIMWLQDRLGQEFDAFICSIAKYGFFVRLKDTHCEGLVPAQTFISHGRLKLDTKNFCVYDKRHDRSYTLGDEVRVRLVWADLDARQISFELVEERK